MIDKFSFTKHRMIPLAVFFLCLSGNAWSEDKNTEELKAQRLELRELLDRIGEAQEQRGKQQATLKKLEKQMSCNWGLLQDYELCEKKHRENLEAHLKCKQDAKAKAAECLSAAAKK